MGSPENPDSGRDLVVNVYSIDSPGSNLVSRWSDGDLGVTHDREVLDWRWRSRGLAQFQSDRGQLVWAA